MQCCEDVILNLQARVTGEPLFAEAGEFSTAKTLSSTCRSGSQVSGSLERLGMERVVLPAASPGHHS